MRGPWLSRIGTAMMKSIARQASWWLG
uniref:Uncharacterized protein n=1 Tax=Arundo donax TaxID=35708 RepID=A0A0A9HIJ9_ARUDO